MNKNVKIAKELVKLAKRLMASDGGVDDLAKGIYDCIKDGNSSYSFYLPSGAIFCITDANVNEGYHECAIVSDFSFGMPTPNAFWFYDMNDINSINENDDLQDCRNTARQIFDLDKSYNFEDADFEEIDRYYDYIYSGKLLGSKKWNDWFNEYDEYEITVEDVYVFMTQKLNYKDLLNKHWKKDGIRCFEQAMEDAYEALIRSKEKSDDEE